MREKKSKTVRAKEREGGRERDGGREREGEREKARVRIGHARDAYVPFGPLVSCAR
jgi:hypothetical protein